MWLLIGDNCQFGLVSLYISCLRVSLVVVIKNQFRRHKRYEFNAWVENIFWRRKQWPTPVLLPGKFHRQRSLVGYSPWGHKRVRHDLVTKQQQQHTLPLFWIRFSRTFVQLPVSQEKEFPSGAKGQHAYCLL